jgi:hypothetical protein
MAGFIANARLNDRLEAGPTFRQNSEVGSQEKTRQAGCLSHFIRLTA